MGDRVRAWLQNTLKVLIPVLLVVLVAVAAFDWRQERNAGRLRAAYLQSVARAARQAGAELDNIARRASVLAGPHQAAGGFGASSVAPPGDATWEAKLEDGIRRIRDDGERRLEASRSLAARTPLNPSVSALATAQVAWAKSVSDFVKEVESAKRESIIGRLLHARQTLKRATLDLTQREGALRDSVPEAERWADDTASRLEFMHQLEAKALSLTVLALLRDQPVGLLPSYVDRVRRCGGAVVCELEELAEMSLVGLVPGACPTDGPNAIGDVRILDDQVVVPLPRTNVCARVRADKWVLSDRALPLATPGRGANQGEFDQAFLLDQHGKTLISVPGTTTHEIRHFDAWCEVESASASACHAKAQKDAGDLAGSGVRTHQIDGVRYLAFYYSIAGKDAAPGIAPGREALFVVGLMRAERLQAESRRIAPTSIFWATLLVGLALLSLPIAKLWLMGHQTRYRRGDVALLVASGALLALIVVAGSWGNHLQKRLVGWQGQRLEKIAKRMADNLEREITANASELERVQEISGSDRARVAEWQSLLGSPQRWTSAVTQASGQPTSSLLSPDSTDTHHGSLVRTPTSASECQVTLWRWTETGDVQPICERVHFGFDAAIGGARGESSPVLAWVTPKGEQLLKYTSEPYSTLPVDLGTWPPVARALKRAACPHEDSGARRGRIYCTDIERSENTGRPRLVTTAFTPKASETAESDQWVSVLGRTPEALFRPVLPRNFEVLVVDAAGVIKSDTNRVRGSMGLNVMADLGDPSDLEAAMRARVSHRFISQYRGVRSQFAVRPVAGRTWSVVGIAPLGEIDQMATTISGVSMSGVLLFLGSLTVVLLLAWLVSALWPRGRGTRAYTALFSFRPQVRLHEHYAVVGMACMTVSFGFVLGSMFIPWLRFWILASLVVLALAMPWLALRLASVRPLAWTRRLRHRFPLEVTYSLWLFGLTSLWIGSPAIVLVAASYDHVVANAVRADQTDLEERLSDRRSRSASVGAGVSSSPVKLEDSPWLLWGTTSLPLVPGTEFEPALFDQTLGLMVGPLGTPRRGDGFLHRAGFQRADWARWSIPPKRFVARHASAIPWMFSFDCDLLLFSSAYVVLSFIGWGIGVLVVRKVFFTDLMSRYRLGQEPFPHNLHNPIGPGQCLVLLGDTATSAALRCDFRFEEIELGLESNDADASRSGSRLPIFIDLTGVRSPTPKWQDLADRFAKRGLLVVVRGDRKLDGGERAVHQAGFCIARAVSAGPLGAPPKVIVHRPSRGVRAAYRKMRTLEGRPRFVKMELRVLQSKTSNLNLAAGQGVLLERLEEVLEDPAAVQHLDFLLKLEVAVVAFGGDLDRFEERVSKKLALFHQAYGPVARGPKWSRYERPTTGEMDAALEGGWNATELAVLRQVAETSFIVPHRLFRPAVERLVSHGLLDPDSLLLHPRFAAHLREKLPRPSTTDADRPERDGTTWDSVKYPLGTAVAAILAAFGITDPSWGLNGALGQSALAALPSLANAAIGLLTKSQR